MRARCWVFVVILLAGCHPAGSGRFQFSQERLLPRGAEAEPWVLAGPVKTYDRQNLYEYLDGRARTYLDYGMRQCLHAEYRRRDDGQRRLIVDLFEMSGAVGAYGLFSSGRPGEAEPLRLGSAAYWCDGRLHLVKDRVCVEIKAPAGGLAGYTAAAQMAALVDGRIDLPAALPVELGVFPAEGKIANSELFVAGDLLGQDFLGDGWLASYRGAGGLTFRLFWKRCDSAGQARQRFGRLRDFAAANGRVLAVGGTVGEQAFLAVGRYVGRLLAVQDGRQIGGAVDCLDEGVAIELVRRLLARGNQIAVVEGR